MKISKVILASKSPRRRELLDQIKVEYECIPSTMEEIMEGDTPSEIVCSLSKQGDNDLITFGSDTFISSVINRYSSTK